MASPKCLDAGAKVNNDSPPCRKPWSPRYKQLGGTAGHLGPSTRQLCPSVPEEGRLGLAPGDSQTQEWGGRPFLQYGPCPLSLSDGSTRKLAKKAAVGSARKDPREDLGSPGSSSHGTLGPKLATPCLSLPQLRLEASSGLGAETQRPQNMALASAEPSVL